MAPPTNLPLSLLWESLVIAIGLNPAAAHLCERGIDTDIYSFPRIVFAAVTKCFVNRRCYPLTEKERGQGPGREQEDRVLLTRVFFFFFFFFLPHISFLLNSPEPSHGSYLSSRLVRALPQR